jgi:hypothetical protein
MVLPYTGLEVGQNNGLNLQNKQEYEGYDLGMLLGP